MGNTTTLWSIGRLKNNVNDFSWLSLCRRQSFSEKVFKIGWSGNMRFRTESKHCGGCRLDLRLAKEVIRRITLFSSMWYSEFRVLARLGRISLSVMGNERRRIGKPLLITGEQEGCCGGQGVKASLSTM